MCPVAVELDDQARGGPDDVAQVILSVSRDEEVDERSRKARSVEKGEKVVFERAAGDGGAELLRGEDLAQRARSMTARIAIEEIAERRPIGQTADLGLVACELELVRGEAAFRGPAAFAPPS